MSVNKLIKNSLILLLILLPSWGVISAQIAYFVGFDQIVTSSRYLIIFGFILLCSIGSVFSNLKLTYSFSFFALLFYSFYSVAHLIGDTEAILLFEGFRHEVLFVIFGFVFLTYGLSNESISYLPSLNVVFITILINGFFAITFALWQFFDISILESLYRTPIEEIGHLTLSIGYRFISTMINPINFGAFLVLFFLVIHYYYDRFKINSLIYYFLTALVFILVVGSLSRLALLALILVLLFLYFYKSSLLKISFFVIFVFLSAIFLIDFVDLEKIMTRVDTLFILSTYTENARVKNWLFAIAQLDSYQYLWGRGIGASSPDSSVVSNTSALRVENAFISVFLQYGLIGLIIFFVIFLRFLYIGYLLVRYNLAVGKFIISFVLFFFAMSIGNDFLRNSPFVFYFWFFYVYFEIFYLRKEVIISDIRKNKERSLILN